MNCAQLQWVADQDDLAPHLQAVLLRLVKLMDDDGCIRMPQSQIAEVVHLGERQTRQAIKDLVAKNALKRTRQGSVGEGRAPDLLSANFERVPDNGTQPPLSQKLADTGEAVPLPPVSRKKRDNGDKGAPSPVSVKNADNGDNAAALPVSAIQDAEFVDNSDAPCIGTSARAQKLTLNTTTSELYPERAESSFESVAREMPEGGGKLDTAWTLSAPHRAFANERGFLNGSCDELFGQFIDRCTTHGPRTSVGWGAEWRKWVRNQVKFDTERAARAPQKYQEANHDNASRAPATFDGMEVRRGKVSPGTALLMRKIAGGDANDERRVEPRTGK